MFNCMHTINPTSIYTRNALEYNNKGPSKSSRSALILTETTVQKISIASKEQSPIMVSRQSHLTQSKCITVEITYNI